MMFFKKEHRLTSSPESFYGTYGVWHMSSDQNLFDHHMHPNPYEKRNKGPCEHQAWIFMGPMEQGMWHADGARSGCFGRRHFNHGKCHQGMNPKSFHEMFNRMQENRCTEKCPSFNPAFHKYGGRRISRHPQGLAPIWFCWRILRRLGEICEMLQIWKESHLDFLSWKMADEGWESLVLWRYLNWLSGSSTLMVTSHTTVSSEIPQFLTAFVFCRVLANKIRPCNSCFYCFGP